MAIFVDTNVILDVLNEDPIWASWSEAKIMQYQAEGLMINPLIYAELCGCDTSVTEVNRAVTVLKLKYAELTQEALFLAAQVYLQYRRRGGTKTSPLPDFFIGAHAAVLDIPLLTRDEGRYRTYFPQVKLICP
jgi:predicted nucleic acid-binding protein